MQAVFTGFDSAWSKSNSGAICDLVLLSDGSLHLAADPVEASWDWALTRASQEIAADLKVWAIDQPLLVCNAEGCRPVERGLASALMADFGCGAHSSNLGISAWARGAPIWKLIRILEDKEYRHNPLAIPAAAGGRFYFECYPHPALLGLFDLSRILKYKVDHRNWNDWQSLIRLLRSLASAELPIKNIGSFVQEGLRQNKKNEDKLDSIISAYVAAYWWKFGIQRSTVIGDLSTGYIVTPHSKRTFAALATVFGGRMNHEGTVSTPLPEIVFSEESVQMAVAQPGVPDTGPSESCGTLPECDWVYFATPAKWSGTVTREFVAEQKVIVRNVHNTAGQRVANVQHLKPGERILLVHGGHGKPYYALFSCTISAAKVPVRTAHYSFDVFSYIDESLHERLKAGGYAPDSVVGSFTGISIGAVQDLREIATPIPKPAAMGTIFRWDQVFSR